MNSGRLGRLSLSYFGKVSCVASLRYGSICNRRLNELRYLPSLLMTYAPRGTATVSMPARGSLGVRLGVLVDRVGRSQRAGDDGEFDFDALALSAATPRRTLRQEPRLSGDRCVGITPALAFEAGHCVGPPGSPLD